MVGQDHVALAELPIWVGVSVDNRLVVTEDDGRIPNGNSKASEDKTELDDLLRASPRGDKLRSKRRSLSSGLQLGEPVDGSLVEQVEDTHRNTKNPMIICRSIGDHVRPNMDM